MNTRSTDKQLEYTRAIHDVAKSMLTDDGERLAFRYYGSNPSLKILCQMADWAMVDEGKGNGKRLMCVDMMLTPEHYAAHYGDYLEVECLGTVNCYTDMLGMVHADAPLRDDTVPSTRYLTFEQAQEEAAQWLLRDASDDKKHIQWVREQAAQTIKETTRKIEILGKEQAVFRAGSGQSPEMN